MNDIGLPPGSILQQMYLSERLRKLSKNYSNKLFLEIGSGNGYVSNVFLRNQWQGYGIDLNASACVNNIRLNYKYILEKKYQVINTDFINYPFDEHLKFDVIVSYMVIEHLNDDELDAFIIKSKSLLSQNGTLIIQVPSNMRFWNIEDQVAGHFKRYELKDIHDLCYRYQLKLQHVAALNYPLSNWLLKISNYIIRKKESDKLMLSQKEKTIYTGNRDVPFKTKFPKIFNIILNPIVMYPFHILQKIYRKKYHLSLILYFEAKK